MLYTLYILNVSQLKIKQRYPNTFRIVVVVSPIGKKDAENVNNNLIGRNKIQFVIDRNILYQCY